MISRVTDRAPGLPTSLRRRDSLVLRPRDAADVYAYPAQEFQRLTERGLLAKVAHGYYAVVPADRVGDAGWRPSVEALALAVGVADHGSGEVALMGLSAARLHGAFPRAHASAWLAVAASRRRLDAGRFGSVTFATRAVGELDTVRVQTELADGWMTSVEQTVLDLARRSDWAGGEDQADAAIAALLPRADHDRLRGLADGQRGGAALDRLGIPAEQS